MNTRRSEDRIPSGLTVKMGMDVHESGGHRQAVSVDFLCAPPRDGLGDLGDHAVGHCHITVANGGSSAVHDGGVTNHKIMSGHVFIVPHHSQPPSTKELESR